MTKLEDVEVKMGDNWLEGLEVESRLMDIARSPEMQVVVDEHFKKHQGGFIYRKVNPVRGG